MPRKNKSQTVVAQNPVLAVFENLEGILKSRRDDKHARYVALDVVRQQVRQMKGVATPAAQVYMPFRSAPSANAAISSLISARKGAQKQSRDRIIAHLMAGEKIQAIKELRVATGVGLKDAKDAVEENPHFAPHYRARA